ncbi:MAG: hypothetical protein WDN03_05385 [Rhizomicrobium sp.]
MSEWASTPLEGPRDESEALADIFYNWELRGRGWQYWPYAVAIEPPFRPIGFGRAADGAERATWQEPWADAALPAGSFIHLGAAAPAAGLGAAVLAALRTSPHPGQSVACELVARTDGVHAQITLARSDIAVLRGRLRDAAIRTAPRADLLLGLPQGNRAATAELVLAREFMLPLGPFRSPGPVGRMVALAAELAPAEAAAMQLLLLPVAGPWASEMLRAVLGPSQDGLFEDDLVAACRSKIAQPLFAAVLRVAGSAPDLLRAQAIATRMAQAFAGTAHGNRLIAADPPVPHLGDLRARLSRRSGMILNAAEISALLAPSQGVQMPVARPDAPVPSSDERVMIGVDAATGEAVRLSDLDRLRHLEMTGGSADLPTVLALHDLDHRNGIAIVDTHGDLYDAVLRRLPSHRLADVALLDPRTSPLAIDLLRADSLQERAVLGEGLLAVLRHGTPGWSRRTDALFHEVLNAVLDGGGRHPLSDMPGLLRKAARDADAAAPLLRRLDKLLEPRAVRTIFSAGGVALDFARILSGGVLLVRIPAGELGQSAAAALGGVVLVKLHQAMAANPSPDRPPFFLTVHGADGLFLPVMDGIVALARSAGVGLVLASGAVVVPVAGNDVSWRSQIGTSVVFPRHGAKARLRQGQELFEVAIAPPPPEPADAFRRAHDAQSVSARRHGLALPAPEHAGIRIARQAIGQADARRRPAFLTARTP